MLMGAGLLSKFVELVASKLIGKRLDIALDERRRACYSFVELLSVLKGFYSITVAFVDELEKSNLETWITINLIVIHRRTIDSLTTRFFELRNDLFFTLEVLDPPLAEIFEEVHAFKGSIFYALAESLTIPEEEPRNQSIQYRRPSELVLAIDLEQFYQSLQSHSGTNSDRPWMWPEELFEMANWETAFPSIQFKTDDRTTLDQFVSDLKHQSQLLEAAIEKLRALIKDNFTLDEVLVSSTKLAQS
jgi:hypothetical protein